MGPGIITPEKEITTTLSRIGSINASLHSNILVLVMPSDRPVYMISDTIPPLFDSLATAE